MSGIAHERPGVYSVYDTSAVVSSGQAPKAVGVAAKAAKGTVGTAVTVTGYAAGAEAFGEDAAPGMGALLRLLFLNGASSVEAASAARRERIAVVGGSGEDVSQLTAHAAALNSERMVLVGPDALDGQGNTLPAVFAAAAVAGAVAAGRDPAAPVNGAALRGLGGLAADYGDSEIDLLVRGGVTPLESAAGIISPVRGITTRTTTGGAADATWREMTTVLIADDVIPSIRGALRSKFSRAKNTARNRGAIRSQVIVELEKKAAAEIIDGYGDVTVSASADDPTVCLVEFGFAVAHGLNQIYLTVHITV